MKTQFANALFKFLFLGVLALASGERLTAADDDPLPRLRDGFVNPPASARPHVWWHWMNGNVTEEGIRADLDAMAAAGIGGAQIFDAGCNVPFGGVGFNTSLWYDRLLFAIREAKKRGIEICLANCSGWSSSGGPWITPERSMKFVRFTETPVTGPSDFDAALPVPKDCNGFYQDIAVLAVPVPEASKTTMESVGYTVRSPLSDDPKRLAEITDLDRDSAFVIDGDALPADEKADYDAGLTATDKSLVRDDEKGTSLEFAFNAPFTVRGFTILLREWNYSWSRRGRVELFASDDGKTWRLASDSHYNMSEDGLTVMEPRYYPVAKAFTARYVRVRISFGGMKGKGSFCMFRLESRCSVPDVDPRSFKARTFVVENEAPPAVPSAFAVRRETVIDLTAKLGADGRLAWSVPAGDWKILRFGMAANGVRNHPSTEFGGGLECDKLSKEALDWHFDQYIGRVVSLTKNVPGVEGAGFNNVLVDSYEVGCQNWTQGFEKEFRARAGYEILPFLPVLAGVVIDDFDVCGRFLWDYRRTIADLFAENYSGRLAARCHENGLKFSLEGYGSCPSDDLQYGAAADIPMAEFWAQGEGRHEPSVGNAKVASSLAHFWGRRFCATESFTAPGGCHGYGRWQDTPRSIKAQGDRVYCAGVNRIIYHRYVHQPFGERYRPGMTMGPWGMHLERTLTWWPQAHAWFKYQARTQFLLQEGRVVNDALLFAGEDVPTYVNVGDLPRGYGWDACTASALPALSVEDGQLVSPGGVRYRVLDIPASRAITPKTLAQLERLAAAGATLVVHGPAPTAGRGLVDGRIDDAALAARAKRLWASPHVIDVGDVADLVASRQRAFDRLGLKPDFASDGGERIDYCHRDFGAGVEAYFVAWSGTNAQKVACTFRVAGKAAEVWDAETGKRYALATEEADGRTAATLSFTPTGAFFVFFTPKADATLAAAPDPLAWTPCAEVTGPFTLTVPVLPPAGGAPTGRTVVRTLAHPTDWTAIDDDEIRYFSGTACYDFTVPAAAAGADGRLFLDLGEVREFAEVTVNGKAYPVLWKKPYRVDVSEFAGRELAVEVKVTNLWPNRLIGDAHLPEDCTWADEADPSGGFAIKAIPEWVKAGGTSPNGRRTFATWRHWEAGDRLLPSGILGPIRLLAADDGRR